MKNIRGKACTALLVATISLSSTSYATSYTVKPGDSFWKIGRKFGVKLESILKANNANQNTIIYPGQVLQIPDGKTDTENENTNNTENKPTSKTIVHTIVRGDTLWKLSRKYNVPMAKIIGANKNINENSILYIGQKLIIPTVGNVVETPEENVKEPEKTKPSKTIVHTIARGDTLWKLSRKYNVSVSQIVAANNNINENSIIYVGQKLIIPSSENIVDTPNEDTEVKKGQTGEYLDWFKEVNQLVPIGTTFKVIDYYTGKSFNMKRTIGAYHADVEALTMEDTKIIKEIWGGFSWTRRPILVQTGNRLIAASMTAMPHAGNDKVKGGVYTNWRSGDYGPGTNFDYIKGNGMDGHVDIHFAGSKRHKDGRVDEKHQQNVKIAAGMIK
ncbi:LysM peptidoglycan-binding domain-containing protein [Anaerosalibacter bizertensis]|uniref:LysM peptidoglycan-binding domain-containing protein n=1 Tax=Anaerosalibacter bizertensis TaxID=932217 RepID=A0A9Q4AB09_9FIRM|nr:LysM peptidoglycan-binding domain-containing protein [Anaerosalibacter bizertensis]MBV1817569.1 LysM peptidoglycan-binding domain-containing protein [Bacteroidales bacterium MSK.15.36]MCB5560015.1 LysM peptidoglycan-binding domain-containing protein [Anaerosalibacter bizertensis]MCG4564077.1 LysM peptidoglycan-binding domain-containing protein [Anaerosalibacter bizertensis]MCG4582883.1 LysM peptidoglycan-binding domain-containing protein [Anaerosalibacter bizertensis]